MSTNDKQSLIGLEFRDHAYGMNTIVEETARDIAVHAPAWPGSDSEWVLVPRFPKQGLLVCRSPVYCQFPTVYESVELFLADYNFGLIELEQITLHRVGAVWRDHNGETCLEPV